MILNLATRVRILGGGQYYTIRLRSLHRAYPSLHPSGVVHWVPEQLNKKAVTGACKLIDGCSLELFNMIKNIWKKEKNWKKKIEKKMEGALSQCRGGGVDNKKITFIFRNEPFLLLTGYLEFHFRSQGKVREFHLGRKVGTLIKVKGHGPHANADKKISVVHHQLYGIIICSIWFCPCFDSLLLDQLSPRSIHIRLFIDLSYHITNQCSSRFHSGSTSFLFLCKCCIVFLW